MFSIRICNPKFTFWYYQFLWNDSSAIISCMQKLLAWMKFLQFTFILTRANTYTVIHLYCYTLILLYTYTLNTYTLILHYLTVVCFTVHFEIEQGECYSYYFFWINFSLYDQNYSLLQKLGDQE